MTSIAIKTGTVNAAESGCRAVMEICDEQGNCCQTSTTGNGLDNPGDDREKGQTDIYTNTTLLGNCAQSEIDVKHLYLAPLIGCSNNWVISKQSLLHSHVCSEGQCKPVMNL